MECTYLSSIRLQNIELGFWPTAEMPLLRLLLKGIKRAKGERAKPKRKPIMLSLLKTLKGALRFSSSVTYDQKKLRAAFTTAFFGVLCASDLCSPSQSFFDPHKTLMLRNGTLLSEVAIVNIKASKGDQFQKGCEVRLAVSRKSVCPIRLLQQHLFQCPAQDAQLFTFSHGTFLTHQIFTDIVKSLLPQSCDKTAYSSHSFRIGATTCAAEKETPG